MEEARGKKGKSQPAKGKKISLVVSQLIAFRGNHVALNKVMQAETFSTKVKFQLFNLRNEILDHHETKAIFALFDEKIDEYVEKEKRQPLITDPIFAPIFAQEVKVEVKQVRIPIDECPRNLTAEDMSVLSWIFEFPPPEEDAGEEAQRED